MAFRTISVVLSANARSLNAALYQAARSIDFFAGGVEGKGVRSLLRFGAAATATTLGAFGIERALKAALTQTVAFDAAMRNVNSISHLSEQQFRGLSQSVLDLSTKLPQDATTLAQGLYDIASSGFQGAQGLTVLKASAQAASAGLSTTATSAQAITAVLNAYGLSADHAGAVSDTLFQTVNVGVVTFDQLAGVLGDVVGIAAQAGVDINQVGSAIATMTLSGIDAAESTTSLNRLLRALIQPSQGLAALFHQLGYESGVAALHARGLHGVMEDIRRATGGNITTLQALFPDIRSLRGALALAANEGRNYNRVAGQIEDADQRQGATHRALAEQMKSLQFQWDLFRNRVSAAAIEATTKVLPSLIQLIQTVERLGHDAMPALISGAHDLAPFFHSLGQIVGDLAHVLALLVGAAAPVAAVLARLVAAATITALDGLAEAIAAVVGFLTHNQVAMAAVATVLGALLIPRVIALGLAMRQAAYTALAQIITGIFAAAEGAVGGVEALRAAFVSLASAEAIASAGLTLGLVGAVEAFNAVADAQRKANETAQQLGSTYRILRPNAAGSTEAIGALSLAIEENSAAWDRNRNAVGFLKGLAQNLTPFTSNTVQQSISNTNALIDERNRLLGQTLMAQRNVSQAAGIIGLPVRTSLGGYTKQVLALQQLADKMHLGEALAAPPEQARAAVTKLVRAWKDLGAQAGVSTGQLAHDVGTVDINALEKLDKEIGKVKTNVRDAFTQANDVIANFHPEQAASDLHQALQSLDSARSSLSDLEAKTGKAAASAKELAAAHQKVADAQQAVNKAQQEGSLTDFYRTQIHESRQFVSNIEDATRRGLDPQFILRLLQAGPAQAGPLLDQLVAAHGNRMIDLANRSEHALSAISRRAVELARLTTLAVASQSDRMGRDLSRAMRIDLETIAEGRAATAQSVAKALGLDPASVTRIAQEFGITLISQTQRTLNQHPLHVTVIPPVVAPHVRTPRGVSFGTVQAEFAEGGPVRGPGGPTADAIVARLSAGEYVQSARAVAYYGRDMMDALNRRALPRYADGGYVGPMPRAWGPPTVTVKTAGGGMHVTNSRTTHVGTVVAHDYQDFVAQMESEARFSNLTGMASA